MLRVVDAHAHAWDPAAIQIDWVAGTALDGPRMPADLDDADGDIAAWVFVEADVRASGEDEVEWVSRLPWPGLVGIVADVDLADPDLPSTLARLRTRSLVCGVRHLLQGEDLTDERIGELGRGLNAVAAAGLTFDVCVRWEQLDAAAALVSAASGLDFVIDHLGKPPVDAGIDSPDGVAWLAAMTRLSRLPGGAVKLSGLRAEAASRDSLMAHGPGFVAAGVALFGAERCLFGTDWPVSVGADTDVTASEWLALVRDAAGSRWPVVAAEAASRVYRLR